MAFRFSYRLIGPADVVVRSFPVAASQTIRYGNLVLLDAQGRIVEAAAGATNILGVAAADYTTGGSPVDDPVLPVILPLDSVFEADYAGTVKTSLTPADVGMVFDILVDGSGDHKVNLDDTTGGMCRVVNFDNNRRRAYVLLTNQLLRWTP